MRSIESKLVGTSLALGLLLSTASSALAQHTVVEGNGYPVGEGAVVHSNVTVEGGVDSNVFYADSARSPGALAAPILRLVASAALASEHNQGPRDKGSVVSREDGGVTVAGEQVEVEKPMPDWDFRLAMTLAYLQYIGVGHSVAGSDVNYSISQQSNLSGGLDAHVESNPEGQFSAFVDNTLIRDNRPRNFESVGNLNRWNNAFQAGLRYRPGSGALLFAGSYENLIDRFDNFAIQPNAQLANRMNHLLRAKAEWQFLPITRFFFDGSLGFFGPLGSGNPEKVSSMPVRAQLGIATLITETISVRAHAGFGKGFYSAGPDFTMAIFGGEFGWRYSPVGRFTIAYDYDFRDSINANFYRDHAVVAKVDHQLQRILLDFAVQARLRGYRGVFASVGDAVRDDLILGTRAKVYYLTRDWLAFNAHLDLVVDATTYRDAMGDDPSYTRVEFVLGATAAF